MVSFLRLNEKYLKKPGTYVCKNILDKNYSIKSIISCRLIGKS